MDVRARWRRVDAEHWVLRWGQLVTALLGTGTAVGAVAGLRDGLLGAVLVGGFWGVITAFAGWLTAAWRDERPWAWWVWTVGTAVLFLSGLAGLEDPSWAAAPWLLVTGGLLLLLAHPDSRARIDRPTSQARATTPAGGPGQYR